MNSKKYWNVWKTTTLLSLETALENRLAAVLFILGKILRFFLFIYFLFFIHQEVPNIKGYNFDQLVIFFLVFNLLDLTSQLLFRGIYWFRNQVISGEFDFKLIKPMSPLFQVMTRETDALDLPLLFLTVAYLATFLSDFTLINSLLFSLYLFIAFLIIAAIHIFVAALGVLTTEVDHTIMIYRDLSAVARVPLNIYGKTLRGLFTYVIPLGLIFTLPAEILLDLIAPQTAILGLFLGMVFVIASFKSWEYALRQYSSASS